MVGQELEQTAAERAAGQNWEANLRGLRGQQPELAEGVAAVGVDVEWVYGRDGTLTAREGGAWWGGCSLPRRTAEGLLKKMQLGATVTCFLSPTHAGQVRVVLDRLGVGKALIVLVPDVRDVRVMLGCEPFAGEIEAGRLWLACGENWADALGQMLREQDGLPTPGQFVRTGLVEEECLQGMIRGAQDVFSKETARRGQLVPSIYAGATSTDGVCAVAPGTFRLWEDVGGVIGGIAAEEGWRVLNPDDPRQGSPVAFARAAAGCSTLVLSNVGRSDLTGELPAAIRLITWVTGPRVPRFEPKGAADVLLVADARWRGAAVQAGWPEESVLVAGWPRERRDGHGEGLGVIADTVALETPAFELSSHKVLWETIARELSDDPFAVGDDAGAYLARWLKRVGTAEETVNARGFVDGLILPAYQQGLVRWLSAAGVHVKLFGRGWGSIPEFAARHVGEVGDRAALRAAVEACAALVHAWPGNGNHPIDSTGRPVLRRESKGREMWLAEAKRLARGEGRITPAGRPVLSAELLRRVIARARPAQALRAGQTE